MWRIIIKRLLLMLVILFILSVITFWLMHASPSDPVRLQLLYQGIPATPELIAEIRQKYGLDDPIWVQYLAWAKNLLQGDFGYSLLYDLPVSAMIVDAIPNSIILAVSAMSLSILISLPLAIIAFRYHDRPIDFILRIGSFVGITIPTFWLSLILIYIFCVRLSLLPIHPNGIEGLILPSLALAVYFVGLYVRRLRGALLEEHNKDYITGARALGLPYRVILWRYLMPNALPSVITMLALSFGGLLGGTVVIESIFGWRGMGYLMVEGIKNNDYMLMQAYVLWGAGIFIVTNIIADVICLTLNPLSLDREVEQ